MRDVVIIGAGPAGSYLAHRLAMAGLDVLLLEEHSEVGEGVVCTGIIGQEAYGRFDLPAEATIGTLQRVRFHSPSGKVVDYRGDAPLATIVCRKKFDAALARRAVVSGAVLWTGSRADEIAVEKYAVRVRVNRGGRTQAIRARLCILSTGFGSALIRRCGFESPPSRVQGAQTVVPFRDHEPAGIYLGSWFAPRGFGWSVPIGEGMARVGVVTDRQASFFLRRILNRPDVLGPGSSDSVPAYPIQASPIPVGTLSRTVSDRIMVVGEAAGQVKTTTQGGIYYGLLSAAFAGETAIGAMRAGDLSREALAPYERRWREKLGGELKLGILLRQFYGGLSDRQVDRLFDIARIDGVLPMIERNVHFDWHGPIIRSVLTNRFIGTFVRSALGIAPVTQ
jgi:digeranylgeranylglycerophospholipid reductase